MNQNEFQINIAKDFSKYPGARYRNDGDHSGQEFYEDILKPKFLPIWSDPKKKLVIDLDGTFGGYASSFISEVFIRLVKDFKDKSSIKERLEFKSDEDPLLIHSIYQIIDDAEPEE